MSKLVSFIFFSSVPLVALTNYVRVRYSVVDDEGRPLSNARVMTYYRDNGNSIWLGSRESCITSVTDSAGIATARLFCRTAEFRTIAECHGFYAENLGHVYLKHDQSGVFSEHLLEHSKDVYVRLFRMKNPIPMYHWLTGTLKSIPKKKGVFGYDLRFGDWVRPYGYGEVSDFEVRYERLDVEGTIKVSGCLSFPSGGAYRMKKIKSASLETIYQADTNAVYVNAFPFGAELPRKGQGTRKRLLEQDEYLVLRTRVCTNATGKVVSAHYSKIIGPFSIDYEFCHEGSYFNPTPNDPNLEYDMTKNLSPNGGRRR